jgi:hypothetical protein
MKDCFYEAIGSLFDTFRKYHMKILLGDFNAEVGKTFSSQLGARFCIKYNNAVREINCATSKNLTVKSTMVPHRNIHV